MAKVLGYAAMAAGERLTPFEFEQREPGSRDVAVKILYCGVCHSDVHFVHDDWLQSNYPMVPGHEIVGEVTHVGNEVSTIQVGDAVGVGCIVDSCRSCPSCRAGLEPYCDRGYTFVYNSPDPKSGGMTYGGFSESIVVDERFIFPIPKKLCQNLAAVAPLMCAGITTYSPLRHWKIGKGSRVAIIGIGGLGHLAVKFAHAMGAEVVAFTTSEKKQKDAARLGAVETVLSTDSVAMKKQAGRFDFILDTLPVPHDLERLVSLLRRDGTLCTVGIPASEHQKIATHELIQKRRSLAGSLIGGVPETQDMLTFCAEHTIIADTEIIPIASIDTAFKRIVNRDVFY